MRVCARVRVRVCTDRGSPLVPVVFVVGADLSDLVQVVLQVSG